MIGTSDCRTFVLEAFKEGALTIGGLIAIYAPDEEFTWGLFRSLDAICARILQRLDGAHPSGAAGAGHDARFAKPHPAVEEFLVRLGRAS